MQKHTPYHLLHKKLTDQISESESNLLDNLVQSDNDFNEIGQELGEIWEKSGSYEPGITFNAEAAFDKFQERINSEKQDISESQDSQVPNEGQPAKVMRMKPTRILLPLAASFLLLLLSMLLYNKYASDTIITKNEATHYALEDGSEIWLNENSQIAYSEEFADNRKVTLTGEAYFKVAKGAAPFIVGTPEGDIEVIATEFNVNTLSNGLEVDVIDGSIKLSNNRVTETVNAGFRAVLADNKVESSKMETRNIANWRKAGLSFKAANIETWANDVEEYFNVDIKLGENGVDKLCNEITSPNVPHTSTIESIFEVLDINHDIEFIKTEDGAFLITKFACN